MKLETFIYPYGAFYDVNLPEGIETSSSVIVYSNVSGVTREIRSLEGIFVSTRPIPPVSSGENPVCTREQMGKFEEKYSGRFKRF